MEVDRLLADLKEVSASLNREMQTLNERIAALEKSVSGLKLGVAVWLSEPIEMYRDDGGGSWETFLGWTKDGKNGWGFYLRYDNPVGDPAADLCRLTDGSRDERLKALAAMPALLKEM